MMRIRPFAHGLTFVAFSALAVACADSQQTRPASEPKPQAAFNDPTVQPPRDPIANNHNAPQQPIDNPTPQSSTFPSHGPQEPFSDPTPQKPFYGPGSDAEDRAQAKTDRPLSDNEVIGVMIAANDGEVKLAEIAVKKATTADAKQFAGMMKAQHSAALQKDKALEKKTKIDATDSDVSTSLKSDVESTSKDLKAKDGKDFDRAYIESQAKAHKDVLTLLDNRLIPSAKSGELKSSLGEMRKVVADHLVKVEKIQQKMDSATTSRTDEKSKDVTKPGSSKAHSGDEKPLEKR